MIKYSMKTIWRARDMIMEGYKVKEVALELKMSESAVRNYTKSERARFKKAAN